MTKASRIHTTTPPVTATRLLAITIAFASLPVLGLASACGGNKPEATSLPAESAPAPPADPASVTAAEPPAAPVTAATPLAASGSSAGSAEPPAAARPSDGIPEPKDECTPVGADFEKRARPKLRECYGAGKKKNPNLEGTVKIKVTVDVKGKIKSTKIVEKTLPDPVADCMLKVVKTTPFPEVDKCWDATLTIPITFPTPR